MLTRPLHHLRHNIVAYLALVAALGAGGGYALAATNTKTITVCADRSTGILHLHARGRCKNTQTRVSWNQRGPQGPQGSQGAKGRAGISVWATVATPGVILPGQGQGFAVQHLGTGTYQMTVTDPTCAQGPNTPVVTLSDGNPPAGQGPGAFPVAWLGDTADNRQFTVYTGVVVGGTFTPTDHTFNVVDGCS